MKQKSEVYCIIFFPETNPKVAFCLDRGYNYIGDDKELWGKITLEDIIETSEVFFPTKNYQSPSWARQIINNGARHIALWTNFYE